MSNIPHHLISLFAGGHDLEMQEILKLVRRFRPQVEIHDGQLRWGAKASTYREEIEQVLADKRCPVLIELGLDLEVPYVTPDQNWRPGKVLVIDHHDQFGGVGAKTSLEQVFSLLSVPESLMSQGGRRRYELVNANDRGHIDSMLELEPPATSDEIGEIRRQERRIQGVTEQDELGALQSIKSRQTYCEGRLTVIKHSLKSSVAITDFMSIYLGGPGYQNLITISGECVDFFGSRDIVEHLASEYPPPMSWSGGSRSDTGYWGTKQIEGEVVIQEVIDRLTITN